MTDTDGEARREFDRRGLERMAFFSDGVIAIAITLLALEIKLPELPADASSGEIGDAVRELIPSIVTFAWSFVVVALFWVQHRHLFGRLERADRRLTVLNTVFLLLIALLPFPSDTLGRFDLSTLTVTLYAANVAGIGLVLGLMSLHADRHLIETGSVGARVESNTVGLFYTGGVFAASLLLAPFRPDWVPWTWWLLLVVIPFLGQRDGDEGPRFGRWQRRRRG